MSSPLVPWRDPLGTVPGDMRGALREVAPIFCDLFANSVYMVRKYVHWGYPIVRPLSEPCQSLFAGVVDDATWLFPANGPPGQADLAQLEAVAPDMGYFRPVFFPNPPPLLHTIVRAERVLTWLKSVGARKEMRSSCNRLHRGDLTSIDDSFVEAIVAFLAATGGQVPPDRISFVRTKSKESTPEFRITTDDLQAIVEVKHILRVPQSEREARWLRAFQRDPTTSAKVRPEDAVSAEIHEKLRTAASGETARAEALPYQKATESVVSHLKKADKQLAGSAGFGCRIAVLYSDDPHTLTRTEDRPECPSMINRIDAAIEDVFRSARHTDAVVLIGSMHGLPIATGHCCKIYHRSLIRPEVERLFGQLPVLRAADIRPHAIGGTITLPPGGKGTITLRV